MSRPRIAGLLLALANGAAAAGMSIPVHQVDAKGVHSRIGTVDVSQSRYGAVFAPKLSGLPPGLHGFHLHEKPSCEPAVKDGRPTAAAAAGDHYDPAGTGKHGAPWDEDAHAGDLPPLYVAQDGSAVQPVLAPRLTLEDVRGRALMIHEHGDNHSDHPEPLGGGGGRIACGVAR